MSRIVWTFGLISGAIVSLMMLLTMPFADTIGYDKGEILGYTSMVLAFLLVFFGIRSYRDRVGGGYVSFGRALSIGALIVAISSVCYTATWEVYYYTSASNFAEKYQAYELDKARKNGASPEAIAKQKAEMQKFAESYKNPLINISLTFLEPLPVGVVIALVSAGVLRRKKTVATAGAAAAVTA